MGEVVNLRQARKSKAHAEADKKAEENRAAFGRSKGEKKKSAAETALHQKLLDGHLKSPPPRGES
jgi:hypothetical protein